MDYRSNLTADEVLQLLEQESPDKDWQDSDEESSDGSDMEAGFCGPENDSMDRTLSLYSMNVWNVTLIYILNAFSPITNICTWF